MGSNAHFRRVGSFIGAVVLSVACSQPAPVGAPAPSPVTPQATAEPWPTKPITIVVSADAGGSIDRMSRILAQYLGAELGQPIVVENKPGGGTVVAHTYVLQQPDDGHTLLVTPIVPQLALTVIEGQAQYKFTDFTVVNVQWQDKLLLHVGKNTPWKTFDELITYIKANPNKVVFGGSVGSAGNLALLSLIDALKLPANAVKVLSYEGGGGLRAAMTSGVVELGIQGADAAETVRDFIRPLAVYTTSRDRAWDAPTINEALRPHGVQVALISGSLRSFIAPTSFKTKYPARWNKLVAATKAALEKPEAKAAFAAAKIPAEWIGPDESAKIANDNYDQLKKYNDQLKAK